MSNSILPTNIDRASFIAGYKEKRAFLPPSAFGAIGHGLSNLARQAHQGINHAVEGYIGRRTANVLKPTMDSARQAGIQFDTNAQGMPVNFDANKSINNIGGNYMSNLGGQIKNWATNQFNQATTDPMSWAKNNPWTAGGTALAGGGLLYGAGKMLFGGSKPQPQQSPYMVPQVNPYMQPQALQKAGGMLPALQHSFSLPGMLAQGLTNRGGQEQPQFGQQPPAQAPGLNISADDPRLHRLLKNPKMQAYLQQLIQQA